MLVFANAKINLSLDVIGRLPNGYHEVCMIMQSVDLHDELYIEETNDDSIILTCDNNELACDDTNLVVRAARLLLERAGRKGGFKIDLKKNIPMAAGLAGGSADAAATLFGINELAKLGFDVDDLCEMGASLGSDIPFCIKGGTCLAEGTGTVLTSIDPMPDCDILLVKPPIDVSTKYVYQNLRLDANTPHPDVKGMSGYISDKDVIQIASNLGNILETVTIPAYPVIEKIKDMMLSNGAAGALMSGSGPTVYGIFDDRNRAKSALINTMNLMVDSFAALCRPSDCGVRIM